MLQPTLTLVLFLLCLVSLPMAAQSAIGVNWGTLSSHRLKPSTVVNLLRDNKISKVKLFEADPAILKALMGSGIQVMVGIPNEMLSLIGGSSLAADYWVQRNVSAFMTKGGADIRFFFFNLRSDLVLI